jgi:FG-GAP repeat
MRKRWLEQIARRSVTSGFAAAGSLAGVMMLAPPAPAPASATAWSPPHATAVGSAPRISPPARHSLALTMRDGRVPGLLARVGLAMHARGDNFGGAVALSGATAVVGAPGTSNQAGAVYIYVDSHGTWKLQATLKDPAGKPGDSFGAAVAVSGSTALVGAWGADGRAGVAYLFVHSSAGWKHQATLHPPAAATTDANFGSAVALSGTTAVIGAPGTSALAGAAYIYERSGVTWKRQPALADPGATTGDNFGGAVASSGTTVAIGAAGTAGQAGAVYLYGQAGGIWRPRATLADPAAAAGDSFGGSVALSGATAVIGAPGASAVAGEVYIYARAAGVWVQQAARPNPAPRSMDAFGYSVAVAGIDLQQRVVVGAPNAGPRHCGEISDYSKPAGNWRRRATITSPQCHLNAFFGWSVAVGGTTAVVGAPGTKDFVGDVYELTIP